MYYVVFRHKRKCTLSLLPLDILKICPTFSKRPPGRKTLRKVTGLCHLLLVFLHLVLDTNERKEAVMNSIRSELALLNVQDLINVRGFLYYASSA